MKGLARIAQVRINVIQAEYAKDELPHPMQVRDDVRFLIELALLLAKDLDRANTRTARNG